MQRYDCEGWLKVVIDMEMREAIVELTHKHHDEYINVRVSTEVKEYICANLRRTPRQLWEDLGGRRETFNLTEKQIHHWWHEFSKKAWKRDVDQFQSSAKLINENGTDIDLMFSTAEGGITAIAFGVKELIRSIGSKAVEIGIDATCKLNSRLA